MPIPVQESLLWWNQDCLRDFPFLEILIFTTNLSHPVAKEPGVPTNKNLCSYHMIVFQTQHMYEGLLIWSSKKEDERKELKLE